MQLFRRIPLEFVVKRFNPYRVFEYVATPLRPWIVALWLDVSIPIGFSSTLQLMEVGKISAEIRAEFQSLSGFRVRCNARRGIYMSPSVGVSIPIGFSSTLQLAFADIVVVGFGVFQSLSGFRVRCNPALWHPSAMAWMSFNPYRVFEYVATLGIYFVVEIPTV